MLSGDEGNEPVAAGASDINLYERVSLVEKLYILRVVSHAHTRIKKELSLLSRALHELAGGVRLPPCMSKTRNEQGDDYRAQARMKKGVHWTAGLGQLTS